MDSLPQSGYKRNVALGLSSKPLIHQGKGCSGVSCGPGVGHRGGNAQVRVVLGLIGSQRGQKGLQTLDAAPEPGLLVLS